MTEYYMEESCGEYSDSCDSEIEEYEDKCYEELKAGKYQIKLPNESFTCPFCFNKKKHDYQYKDLLQHATMIGKSTSTKRSNKDTANHIALTRYLKKEISEDSSQSQVNNEVDLLADHDADELFVFPWKGIVVNLPIELTNKGYVGKSGSSLREDLTTRGFNPTRVMPLWNFNGHSGSAVVEFKKDIIGLYNAISFEKFFESNNHGKKDWKEDNNSLKSGIYGWVARVDDYKSNNIIGERLQKIADLRTLSDIKEEEKHPYKKLYAEKDKILESYNEGIKKIQGLESEKKELELQVKELQKREVVNENERKKMAQEIQENAVRNRIASDEKRKADENVMKLMDDHKKEKEKLHEEIILLKKQQLDAQQSNVMKHMSDDDDLVKKLKEKQEEIESLESFYGALTVREKISNDQLQKTRKVLIEYISSMKHFKELPKVLGIGLKRMGELDNKPFLDAMNRIYNATEAEYKASQVCSLWEEYLRDPNWHPFKIITLNGELQQIVDENDGKLKSLRGELGEEVYKAVTTALREINEFNPSGSYVTTELWNFSEGRKASVDEGVSCLCKMLDAKKRKRIT